MISYYYYYYYYIFFIALFYIKTLKCICLVQFELQHRHCIMHIIIENDLPAVLCVKTLVNLLLCFLFIIMLLFYQLSSCINQGRGLRMPLHTLVSKILAPMRVLLKVLLKHQFYMTWYRFSMLCSWCWFCSCCVVLVLSLL